MKPLPPTTDFGRRLEHALGDGSLEELARRAGVNRATIWRSRRPGEGQDSLHRGQNGLTMGVVERLAKALGVAPAWLGFGTGPMREEPTREEVARVEG